MNTRDVAVAEEAATKAVERLKKAEFRAWFFLTVVMAPVLAVLTVSGYGLLVWMYQLFAGPPGA